MDNNQLLPLVTVCVVTYNSEDFILETLESIKNQTYKNFELIISDDGSSDNTLTVAKKWLEKNDKYFVRTHVVSTEKNTGTAANYNRGIFASKGEWIKFIDGDDLLTPNCLEDNVDFINHNKYAKVIFSQVEIFKNDKKSTSLYFDNVGKDVFNMDVANQLKVAIKSNPFPSASLFINKELITTNPFNEKYFVLEDAPKWIDLLIKGNRFCYFDKVTAKYRYCESVMRSQARFYSPLYAKCSAKYFWEERIDIMHKYDFKEAYDYQRKYLLKMDLAIGLLHNKKSFWNNVLFKMINKIVDNFVSFKM